MDKQLVIWKHFTMLTIRIFIYMLIYTRTSKNKYLNL